MAPASCRLPSLLRLAQAACCCVSFSTASAAGPWLPGEGDGCVAAWALSFGLTLLLLAAEAFGRLPSNRPDLPLAHAAAAASACAAASVVWPLGHLRGGPGDEGRARALRAVASSSSVLAFLLYVYEIGRDRAKPGQTAPFLATPGGLLKIGQTFLALLLLGVAAELGAGRSPEAWRWCLGIYCGGFAAGLLLVGGCLMGWGYCGGSWGMHPETAKRVLGGYAAAGAALFAVASVLWPLYGFRGEMGGQERRPGGCGNPCGWERRVLVAVLTPLGALLYAYDLVQTGRLVLLRV